MEKIKTESEGRIIKDILREFLLYSTDTAVRIGHNFTNFEEKLGKETSLEKEKIYSDQG